jgi:uncharacterized protein DUF6131
MSSIICSDPLLRSLDVIGCGNPTRRRGDRRATAFELRSGGNNKQDVRDNSKGGESLVMIVGVILLLLGLVLSVPVLWVVGLILLLVGAVLWVAGSAGHALAGRRHYW